MIFEGFANKVWTPGKSSMQREGLTQQVSLLEDEEAAVTIPAENLDVSK